MEVNVKKRMRRRPTRSKDESEENSRERRIEGYGNLEREREKFW